MATMLRLLLLSTCLSLLACAARPGGVPDGDFSALPYRSEWIDTHVHLRSHTRIADYVAYQERFGMSAMVLQAAPNIRGLLVGGRPNLNAEALFAKLEHPERFYVFGTLDLSPGMTGGAAALQADVGAQIDRLAAAGVDGLKLYFKTTVVDGLKPHGVNFVPDDPVLAPMWERVKHHGLPVLIHIDEPYFSNGRATLEAHPEVTFLVTHLAFARDNLARLESVLNASPRVYLDVGHFVHLGELLHGGAAARDFLERHAGRFMQSTDMGSGCGELTDDDCPTEAVAIDQAWRVRAMLETDQPVPYLGVYDGKRKSPAGLKLSAEALQHLYAGTARAVLGSPRPPSCQGALDVVDSIRSRTTEVADQARLAELRGLIAARCP